MYISNNHIMMFMKLEEFNELDYAIIKRIDHNNYKIYEKTTLAIQNKSR